MAFSVDFQCSRTRLVFNDIYLAIIILPRILTCNIHMFTSNYLKADPVIEQNVPGNIVSTGKYVPWLIRRTLKHFGNEKHCRLEVVTSCNGVVEVFLSRKNLNVIPQEIFDFLSLETLRLDNNNFEHLDANIGRLRNLKCLFLGKNQLSTLPASLANCKYITELDIQSNRLSAIPACIWRLKRLVSLDLSWNHLKAVSPEISKLQKLRWLNIEGNALGNFQSGNEQLLPNELSLLRNLKSLNIAENGFEVLPSGIAYLPNLRSLNLAGNVLSDLPSSFSNLEFLCELSLAGNKLTTLPPCLNELKSLRYLNVSRNLLQVLPANLASLDRLQILLAVGNNLIAVSDCLSHNLQVLDVSQNQLRSLSIGKLKYLCELNISHNRFEVMPMGLGISKGSKRLTRLFAGSNRISRLNADELRALDRLEAIDLSENNISSISADLLRHLVKNVSEYCLSGNPIASKHSKSSIYPMCCHSNEGDKRFTQHLTEKRANVVTKKVDNVTCQTVLSNSTDKYQPLGSSAVSSSDKAIYSTHLELSASRAKPNPSPNPIQNAGKKSMFRLFKVGPAGGNFHIDFSKNVDSKYVRNASPLNKSDSDNSSPYVVKIIIPPQAFTATQEVTAEFFLVDEVGLAEIGNEETISHVIAFSPVIFIKPLSLTTADSRLFEDLTVILNLSPQAESALVHRSSSIHVVDVLTMSPSTADKNFQMVCAPHPSTRMSLNGNQVYVKFSHLGNGIAVLISKTCNKRKACKAAEQLLKAELDRKSLAI